MEPRPRVSAGRHSGYPDRQGWARPGHPRPGPCSEESGGCLRRLGIAICCENVRDGAGSCRPRQPRL